MGKQVYSPDANSLASIYSLAKDHGLAPIFFGIRKDSKPSPIIRDRLLVMWDFWTLGPQPYQVEEAEARIKTELRRRFDKMTVQIFKAFSHPSQSNATDKLTELGWRVWEDNNGIDDKLIDQARSDAGQDPKATILVLITRDEQFIDLIDEMHKKGVRVYLIAPRDADDDLIEEVGRKRWVEWKLNNDYLSVLNYPIPR
ncbi:NYN domain-containing protein [Chloroflexota bacterium]